MSRVGTTHGCLSWRRSVHLGAVACGSRSMTAAVIFWENCCGRAADADVKVSRTLADIALVESEPDRDPSDAPESFETTHPGPAPENRSRCDLAR